MPDDRDLLDLVDTPTESLTIEIKSNFDIANDRAHRAHLARHICALANFGGGFIVFGFDNDLRPIVLPADIDQTFHRDRVSSIVATYLDPALLCDSVIITSSAGNRHPVIP
jgi:predicted HTH transcriptional regulator